MSFEDVVNILVNNGMSICITAYFLYRDYKFNEQQIVLLTSIREIVKQLQNKDNNEE